MNATIVREDILGGGWVAIRWSDGELTIRNRDLREAITLSRAAALALQVSLNKPIDPVYSAVNYSEA